MSPSETLERELRAARPAAPAALRERVRTIAAEEPQRESFLQRLSLRRFVLVATPATVVVALIAAGVIGLSRGSDDSATFAEGGGSEAAATTSPDAVTSSREAAPLQEDSAAPPSAGALPPTQGRLQRYDAQLQLQVDGVDELSSATQQAMRITRSIGGTVSSVSYDAPSQGVGSAQLTLRVPVARVQQAIVQLSGLGTILSQRYGIEDLQPAADDLAQQIADTQARIAQLNESLGNPNRTPAERAVLQAQLAEARRQLRDLRAALEGTRAEARLATIQLGLTTEEVLPAPAEEEGALDGIVDVLRWEALALLYVLVIAGPFVLVGLAVWLVLRLRRRHVEARLLEQN
jgi:Domain of unknown function (DUF4349)